MKRKKILPLWLAIILSLLCVAAAMYDTIACITVLATTPIASLCFFLCALIGVFSLLYCATGCEKNSALFYKGVCILTVVTCFIGIISCGLSGQSGTAFLVKLGFYVIIAIIFVIFSFIKDLGKKVSLILLCIMYVVIALYTVYTVGINPSAGLTCLSFIVYAIVFGTMVYGKYKDKEARGR